MSRRRRATPFDGAGQAELPARGLSARAAGLPDPGLETLQAAFAQVFEPTAFPDVQAAEHYRARSESALRRFFERELA